MAKMRAHELRDTALDLHLELIKLVPPFGDEWIVTSPLDPKWTETFDTLDEVSAYLLGVRHGRER